MPKEDLTGDDALLVLDVQNCFMPGGSLAIEGGDEIVPVLNDWIEEARKKGAFIAASRDWHPPGHVSFEEKGGAWPPHCVAQTEDAAFHPDLNLPDEAMIVTKGHHDEFDQYSVFDRTGLAEELKSRGVRRVWVGGLAQDVCVLYSVMHAQQSGFECHVIQSATKPVNANPGDGQKALEQMREAGAVIE